MKTTKVLVSLQKGSIIFHIVLLMREHGLQYTLKKLHIMLKEEPI